MPSWDLYPTGRQRISKQIIKSQIVISLNTHKKAVLGAEGGWFRPHGQGRRLWAEISRRWSQPRRNMLACADQEGGHKPCMATELLKCSWSKLRCDAGARYTLGFKDLEKKEGKNLSIVL